MGEEIRLPVIRSLLISRIYTFNTDGFRPYENRFPGRSGRDASSGVLTHYEGQTDDEAAEEDEAAVAPAEPVMSVPRELVAQVRDLIAKNKG
jgi:hypothetical protein